MPDTCIQWRAGRCGPAPGIEPLLACLSRLPRPPLLALAPPPGAALFAGDPVWQLAFAEPRGLDEPALEPALADLDALLKADLACRRLTTATAVQLYRQLDEQGRFRGDRIIPLEDDPVAGMVLMHTVWHNGRAVPPPQPAWLVHQSRAMPARPGDYPVLHPAGK